MTNLFRQASELLKTKKGSEMSEEELQIINTALIPLVILKGVFPQDITMPEGLEALAQMVEEEHAGIS